MLNPKNVYAPANEKSLTREKSVNLKYIIADTICFSLRWNHLNEIRIRQQNRILAWDLKHLTFSILKQNDLMCQTISITYKDNFVPVFHCWLWKYFLRKLRKRFSQPSGILRPALLIKNFEDQKISNQKLWEYFSNPYGTTAFCLNDFPKTINKQKSNCINIAMHTEIRRKRYTCLAFSCFYWQ